MGLCLVSGFEWWTVSGGQSPGGYTCERLRYTSYGLIVFVGATYETYVRSPPVNYPPETVFEHVLLESFKGLCQVSCFFSEFRALSSVPYPLLPGWCGL